MINLNIQIEDTTAALEIRKALSNAAWHTRHESPGTADMLDAVIAQIVAQMWEPSAPVYECTDCGDAMTANVSRCDACIEAEDESDRIAEILRVNGPDYDFHNEL